MTTRIRYEDNCSGPFFVDTECIACDTCTAIAPSHFKLVANFDHAITYFQPNSKDEKDSCFKALEACPVNAIGYSDDSNS